MNPDEQITQWITPLVEAPGEAGGWYIYRTAIPIPVAPAGYSGFLLTASGYFLDDDQVPAFIVDDGKSCKGVLLPSLTAQPAPNPYSGFSQFQKFRFETTVVPGSVAYLYVPVFNVQYPNGFSGNATGLLVKFDSAYFTPIR